MAAHGIAAITAVGTILVTAALAHQLTELEDRFFDTAATAVGAIALLWMLGSLFIAFTLWRGPSTRPALLLAATLVVVSAGGAGYAWWKDRPPYAASSVQATATLTFTERQFTGRVVYTAPPCSECTYHVIVIDKRENQVADHLFTDDGGGWSSELDTLAARYPWLSATAPKVTGAGFLDAGMAVSRRGDEPGPIAFEGGFTEAAQEPDPLVALVLSGPENQIYWAKRVSG